MFDSTKEQSQEMSQLKTRIRTAQESDNATKQLKSPTTTSGIK